MHFALVPPATKLTVQQRFGGRTVQGQVDRRRDYLSHRITTLHLVHVTFRKTVV